MDTEHCKHVYVQACRVAKSDNHMRQELAAYWGMNLFLTKATSKAYQACTVPRVASFHSCELVSEVHKERAAQMSQALGKLASAAATYDEPVILLMVAIEPIRGAISKLVLN